MIIFNKRLVNILTNMSASHTFTCLFEKKWYSDFKCVINNKEYNLHTKFLINESEFFKCLINNSQMNISEPIIITGSSNKIINSLVIDQIIKWFYHNDLKKIPILNCDYVDKTLNFYVILEYYYASNFLQIDKIKIKCLEIMDEFFNILITDEYSEYENLKLINDNNTTHYYKFMQDNNFSDIDYSENFSAFLNKILTVINTDDNILNCYDDEIFIKILNIYNKNYEKNFCDLMNNYLNEKINKKDLILQMELDKRSSMKNMKIYIDDLLAHIAKDHKYYPLNKASISLYDFEILLDIIKNEQKKVLVKLLRFEELIKEESIINEKTLTFERLCKKHNLDSKYRKKIIALCKDFDYFI